MRVNYRSMGSLKAAVKLRAQYVGRPVVRYATPRPDGWVKCTKEPVDSTSVLVRSDFPPSGGDVTQTTQPKVT